VTQLAHLRHHLGATLTDIINLRDVFAFPIEQCAQQVLPSLAAGKSRQTLASRAEEKTAKRMVCREQRGLTNQAVTEPYPEISQGHGGYRAHARDRLATRTASSRCYFESTRPDQRVEHDFRDVSVARFPGALRRQGSCGGRFTFQNPLKADGNQCPRQGTRDIDPGSQQIATNQVRGE